MTSSAAAAAPTPGQPLPPAPTVPPAVVSPPDLPSSIDPPARPKRSNPIKVLPGRLTPSRPGQTASPAEPGAGSGVQLPADPLAHANTGTRSSDRPAAAGPKLDRKVWQDILRGLFQQLGDLLHDRLATLPADRADQIWRADEDDAAAVTDPIANVVHRRVQVPGGADVADMVTAGAALAGYSIRNLRRMLTNRRAVKRRAQSGISEPEPQDAAA